MNTFATSIATTELQVRYGKTVAVTDVNLNVPAGTLLSIIGPNGAGKSALLKALAGAVQIHSGKIEITGPAPSFVMQSTDVDPSLPISVKDVVSLARYSNRGAFKRFRKEDRNAVDSALERLNLKDLAKRQLHELSGGQRQRVLVAQGLAQESNVLLLDEPINVNLGVKRIEGSSSGKYLEEGSYIRSRVVSKAINQNDPRASKIGLNCKMDGLGAYSWIQEQD